MSANVLDIGELLGLDVTSMEPIIFSCHKMREKVEWYLDSGCMDHITPRKSNFIQYQELLKVSQAEIADGKFLSIEGYGTVIRESLMLTRLTKIELQNVLYVPQANKWLFLLIAARQHGSMSQMMNKGPLVSQNGTQYIYSMPKSGKLHCFDMVLAKNKDEAPRAQITTMISDYTLWHERMGHTHQHVIKHLGKNMEAGPHQTTSPPLGACEGCEKGKSK